MNQSIYSLVAGILAVIAASIVCRITASLFIQYAIGNQFGWQTVGIIIAVVTILPDSLLDWLPKNPPGRFARAIIILAVFVLVTVPLSISVIRTLAGPSSSAAFREKAVFVLTIAASILLFLSHLSYFPSIGNKAMFFAGLILALPTAKIIL